MFNAFAGAVVGSCAGVTPSIGAIIGMALPAVLGSFMPANVLLSGVFTEIWTGEIIKSLKEKAEGLFLQGVPDYSQYAENDVIHMTDCGVEPDVLINNTTYPLDIQSLSDTDKTFSLDKYQTKPTPITDDELHACSYDKIASVKERHANKIAENKFAKALHALAPTSNSANTPVIDTTGETVDGRKRITKADIIALKKAFDTLKLPVLGRRLVLCSEHVNDLLLSDQKFADQYYNYTTGKIANLFGFQVFEYNDPPVYTTAGTKRAFGAAAATGDRNASVAFIAQNTFKAAGSTKMYASEASTDPQNQRNLISFRHYFTVLPKLQKGLGAIVSTQG